MIIFIGSSDLHYPFYEANYAFNFHEILIQLSSRCMNQEVTTANWKDLTGLIFAVTVILQSDHLGATLRR